MQTLLALYSVGAPLACTKSTISHVDANPDPAPMASTMPASDQHSPNEWVRESVGVLQRVQRLDVQIDYRTCTHQKEGQTRDVSVGPVLLGVSEVTWADYNRVMVSESEVYRAAEARCPTCPATGLSWCEAVQFANVASIKEGLSPAYWMPPYPDGWESSRSCDMGGARVHEIPGASGYRLPRRDELIAVHRGLSLTPTALYRPSLPQPSCGDSSTGICGIKGGAREWTGDYAWRVGDRPGAGCMDGQLPPEVEGMVQGPGRVIFGAVGSSSPIEEGWWVDLPFLGDPSVGFRVLRPITDRTNPP